MKWKVTIAGYAAMLSLFLLTACGRQEGVFNFNLTSQRYEVIEVRPGLTCVFTNGVGAGVSCVSGTFE